MTTNNAGSQSTVELDQGPIRYRELGSGEPIVFVHGFLVDGRLWDGVAERLADRYRCILPDWPMGSHVLPMKPDADLTPPGIARLISDFLVALDLDRVTIVGNDSGGAISQVLVTSHPDRIARLVLTNCDSYDNFPPFPFNAMPPLARLPGGVTALALPFRLGPIARGAYRQFSNKVSAELVEAWLSPSLRDPEIKRDTRKFTVGIDKRHTLAAAKRFGELEIPVLLAWAPNDRFFKLSDAERLAEAIPDSRLETIEGAKTFVALDQPQRLAELIGAFVDDRERASAAAARAD
jgi:pimeloyl-ACP methyl ester carboxylesterase